MADRTGDSLGPRFSRVTVYAAALDYLRWLAEREIAEAEERLDPHQVIEVARHKLAVLRDLAHRDAR